MYYLSEDDRWVLMPGVGGDVRIKRIPDQGTFWRVVEGLREGVVGVGLRMKREKEEERKGKV